MPEGMTSVVVCANGHPSQLDFTRKRWPRRCRSCASPLPCAVEGGCDQPVLARCLCHMHYHRRQAHGDPRISLLIQGNDWDRFMSHVQIEDETDCWLWTGGLDEKGYGAFNHRVDGKQIQVRAHRWAWIEKNGPVPGNLGLDHFKCDRPLCANPEHVRPVTQRENVLRGSGLAAWNLTKTHCPKRHPYDEANTYVDKRGSRTCRECKRVQHREYMRKRPRR